MKNNDFELAKEDFDTSYAKILKENPAQNLETPKLEKRTYEFTHFGHVGQRSGAFAQNGH